MVKNLSGIVLLLSTSMLHAASIKLNWSESADAKAQDPGTVNIYRRTAACPQSVSGAKWLKLATDVPAGGPYVDNAANLHYPHCYYITATIDGVESAPSNMTFMPPPLGSIPATAPQ